MNTFVFFYHIVRECSCMRSTLFCGCRWRFSVQSDTSWGRLSACHGERYVHLHTYIYILEFVCVCVWMFVYLCVCVCNGNTRCHDLAVVFYTQISYASIQTTVDHHHPLPACANACSRRTGFTSWWTSVPLAHTHSNTHTDTRTSIICISIARTRPGKCMHLKICSFPKWTDNAPNAHNNISPAQQQQLHNALRTDLIDFVRHQIGMRLNTHISL